MCQFSAEYSESISGLGSTLDECGPEDGNVDSACICVVQCLFIQHLSSCTCTWWKLEQ